MELPDTYRVPVLRRKNFFQLLGDLLKAAILAEKSPVRLWFLITALNLDQ